MEFDLQKGTIRPTVSSSTAPPVTFTQQPFPTPTQPTAFTSQQPPIFQPFTQTAVPTAPSVSSYGFQQPAAPQPFGPFQPVASLPPTMTTANIPTTSVTGTTIPTSTPNISITNTGGVSLDQLKELLSTVLIESKQPQQTVIAPPAAGVPPAPAATPSLLQAQPFGTTPSTAVVSSTTGVQRLVPVAGVPAIPSVLEPQNAAAGVTVSAGPTGLVQIRPPISTSAGVTPAGPSVAAAATTVVPEAAPPKPTPTTMAPIQIAPDAAAVQKQSIWNRIPRWVIYVGIGVLVVLLIWMIRRLATKRTEKENITTTASAELALKGGGVRQVQKYARPSGHPSELLALPPPSHLEAYQAQSSAENVSLQNPIKAAMHALPPRRPSNIAATTAQRPSAASAAIIAGQKSIQSAEAKIATQRVASSTKATSPTPPQIPVQNKSVMVSKRQQPQQKSSTSMTSTTIAKRRPVAAQQSPDDDNNIDLMQYEHTEEGWTRRSPGNTSVADDLSSMEEYQVFIPRTRDQGTHTNIPASRQIRSRTTVSEEIHLPHMFDGTNGSNNGDASTATLLSATDVDEDDNVRREAYSTTNKRAVNNENNMKRTPTIIPAWNDYVMVTHANNGSASHVGGSSAFLPDSTMWQAYPVDEIMPRRARPNN